MAQMSVKSNSLMGLFRPLTGEERRQFESILKKILVQADSTRS